MFDLDGIFNYVIFLIPLALVVSRVVGRLRAKKNPPPPVKKKPAQAYVPVHFEVDTNTADDDDSSAYFRKRNAAEDTPLRPQTTRRKAQKNVAAPFTPKPELLSTAVPIPQAAVPLRNLGPASQTRRSFEFELNHLSALKQAVVMSEILGQPKGMKGLWGERPGQGE